MVKHLTCNHVVIAFNLESALIILVGSYARITLHAVFLVIIIIRQQEHQRLTAPPSVKPIYSSVATVLLKKRMEIWEDRVRNLKSARNLNFATSKNFT